MSKSTRPTRRTCRPRSPTHTTYLTPRNCGRSPVRYSKAATFPALLPSFRVTLGTTVAAGGGGPLIQSRWLKVSRRVVQKRQEDACLTRQAGSLCHAPHGVDLLGEGVSEGNAPSS